ncbi:MAG: hypothetical protein ABIG28_00215 [archaeon]
MKKRGFIIGDYLIWWIIAFGVLVFMAILFLTQTEGSNSAIDALKNFFRLGK